MADDLIKSAGICAANSSCLKDYLRFYKVPVYLESSLKEIKDNGRAKTTDIDNERIAWSKIKNKKNKIYKFLHLYWLRGKK